MTWRRRDGYYYRSEREGDTVRSVYIGPAPRAQIFLALEDECRFEAAMEATARREAQAALDAEDAAMAARSQETITLTRAILSLAGYYWHHQGEWRKRPGTATD